MTGRVGMRLNSGQVVLTASGRRTTPFPRVDVTTPRRTTHTLNRVADWLMENAMAEAAATGGLFPGSVVRPWSQADMDLAELVLFGQ